MPTFIVYSNTGVKKISMEGANREGLEKLVNAAHNLDLEQAVNEEETNNNKNKRPQFEAPKYKSEEERRRRTCCVIS
jgi:hypothetical protein